MGSKGKPLFDLNEPATEEDEESDGAFCIQPQRAVPSTAPNSDLFTTSSPPRIVNNSAFSHASSVSGFQPFIRSKGAQESEVCVDQSRERNMIGSGSGSAPQLNLGSALGEKEEGEWSDDAEGSVERSVLGCDDNSQVKEAELIDQRDPAVAPVDISWNVNGVKDNDSSHASLGLGFDADTNDRKSSGSRNSEGSIKGDISMDGQEDSMLAPKPKDIKGAEAIHVLKLASNPGKRLKLDQQKEAMLGKKRSRQTMFLNLEDVKQAGPIKTSTPRRQNFPAPTTTRIVRETRPGIFAPAERSGEKQFQPAMTKDTKQVDLSCNEGNSYVESNDPKSECSSDMNSGILARPRRMNSATDVASESQPSSFGRQSSLKQLTDIRQLKNSQVPVRKTAIINQNSIDSKSGVKKLPSKKPSAVVAQYQDTSVERLLREVTNEKFWQHPATFIMLIQRFTGCQRFMTGLKTDTIRVVTFVLLSMASF